MPPPRIFIRQVNHALVHLYDPDVLRSHPLIQVFGIRDRVNPYAALKNILVESIEELKPRADVPPDSRTWRVYKLLHMRFVQKMDQEQTAYQLGIGIRHLRREQKASIGLLADTLSGKFQLDEPETAHSMNESEHDENYRLEEEFFWLKSPSPAITSEVNEVFSGALEVVEVLADKLQVDLQSKVIGRLPPLAINPAALRQMTIGLISYAISRVPGGTVLFEAETQMDQKFLLLRTQSWGAFVPASPDIKDRLGVIRSMLAKENLCFHVSESVDQISLETALPIAVLSTILVIDDNADICQLFERYTAGTYYRVISAKHSGDLFKLVEDSQPDLMVLDVMMPGADGWEVLGQVIHHPLTHTLPIVICTVMPERDLAMALGATAYLPKPVTRDAFLKTLSEVLAVR